MMVTNYSINETGLREISEFLAARHKLGGEHFTRDMILAWAADAEAHLANGNPATIEIPAWDSVSGHAEVYEISGNGLDAETVEIDE